MSVQTKITLTLEPHDLKIINEALVLFVARMEDVEEHPANYTASMDNGQIDMFANDAKVKGSEARSIINAIS
jgi:hypothetical protein